jgi:hypothetical protein
MLEEELGMPQLDGAANKGSSATSTALSRRGSRASDGRSLSHRPCPAINKRPRQPTKKGRSALSTVRVHDSDDVDNETDGENTLDATAESGATTSAQTPKRAKTGHDSTSIELVDDSKFLDPQDSGSDSGSSLSDVEESDKDL